MALSTNAVVRAGDGGNATTSVDSLGGNGGVAGLVMVRAGTVTVDRDLSLTSGRGGRGAQGGNVGPSFLLAVLPPLIGGRPRLALTPNHQTDSVPEGADDVTQAIAVKRSQAWRPSLSVQVGRDLRLTSATGGEGSAGWGGNCSLGRPAQLAANQGGVTLNTFGAALSVQRHLVITGCSGGVGRGGPGGWAAPAGLAGLAPHHTLMKMKLLMWLVMVHQSWAQV